MTSKTPKAEEEKGEKKTKKVARKQKKAKTAKDTTESTPTPVIKKGRKEARDIGVDVALPTTSCDDKNCPFHGSLRVRGLMMEGEVVSDRMMRGAVVKRDRMMYDKKYERYLKASSRYRVHNPPCINAKKGDWVKIMECRAISKTKSFVIIEKKEGA
jgi:small subunit ribosomal protein S17